jgi:hypothetical protein
MAFYDTNWYCNAGDQSTTGYYAVTKWATGATIAAGALRRQNTAPAVGSERVFVCIVAGTTNATTEPTWVLTRGAKTTDNTVTWQECTGASAVNGDLTNTTNWTAAKAAGVPTLGAIIKRNNGASYQICTTAGTLGSSEPAFSDTAGVTTTETAGTTVWTSLGVVGNFTGGQAPHARLENACASTWFAAGNTICVGDNHAESKATAITFSPIGSATLIGKILCHNHSGSYPPASSDLTTGATISCTGAAAVTLFGTNAGAFYVYGMTFKAGVGQSSGQTSVTIGTSGAVTSLQNSYYFDNCSFWLANTAAGAGGQLLLGNGSSNAGSVVIFNNTSVKFASTGEFIVPVNNVFIWQNTSPALVSGSSVPTRLFDEAAPSGTSIIVLEALDLSMFSGAIYTSNASILAFGNLTIKDCKLHASATVSTPVNTGLTVQLIRSDSGATGYKSTRYQYEGAESTETSITRVGGAADPTGQAQSRKIATTANSQWLRPFKAEPYAIWNPTTGANVTVTVCGTVNAGALPNNDDIWLEVEYLGSSGSPLGTIVTTTKANLLTANAAIASDGSTWNGGGSGAGWSPFKLTATLSSPQPGMAGYLHARVRAAKPSTTYYIDPKIILT